MKRITVDHFQGFHLLDVYFMDMEASEGIEELKQGLTPEQASDYIDELIVKHNMIETDHIRNNYFDEKEYLTEYDKLTIKQYEELKGEI